MKRTPATDAASPFFRCLLAAGIAPLFLAAACSDGTAGSDTGEQSFGDLSRPPEDAATELAASLACPPPGPYGTKLGDTVKDLAFEDADGSPVTLHGLCGKPLSLIYHFYGW